MRYEVRRLHTGDLPSVTELYNAASRARESTQGTRPWSVKEMKEFLFETCPSFESYTCIDNGDVVGWTALTRHHANDGVKHTAEMSLYVQESFRRKGIGSALAHTLLSRASTLNLHCILAIVFKDMPDVVSFAERKCGFSVAGCLPEAFPDSGKYHDVLVLEKLMVA
ncbi:GNAT family N-acetyltransferase [Bradyrhizobium icense]|uniref:GNAT family N-acetyltransferase n=1 Tax=Bradyrhizobium icense TaxID=1274631 RepID=UPI0009F424F9|nr:GNAT family N-acetyltransferase [Bradyrhizobium icense]